MRHCGLIIDLDSLCPRSTRAFGGDIRFLVAVVDVSALVDSVRLVLTQDLFFRGPGFFARIAIVCLDLEQALVLFCLALRRALVWFTLGLLISSCERDLLCALELIPVAQWQVVENKSRLYVVVKWALQTNSDGWR